MNHLVFFYTTIEFYIGFRRSYDFDKLKPEYLDIKLTTFDKMKPEY